MVPKVLLLAEMKNGQEKFDANVKGKIKEDETDIDLKNIKEFLEFSEQFLYYLRNKLRINCIDTYFNLIFAFCLHFEFKNYYVLKNTINA